MVTGLLKGGTRSIQESTRRLVTRDASALLSLHATLAPRGDLQPASGWAATPETILALVGEAGKLHDGDSILEIGSGISTVWLALAIHRSGKRVSIVSLEHDEHFAEVTRAALKRQEVEELVELRIAPLVAQSVEGRVAHWYEPSVLDGIADVALLFVDGPPGSTGPSARYPAFPLARGILRDGAAIVLDDTNREDEAAIVEAWVEAAAGELVVERILEEATVLRYRPSA
jgi:predicted O-methyltransferase YrrM